MAKRYKNLRAWVLAGLPPAYRIRVRSPQCMTIGQKDEEIRFRGVGREVNVNDNSGMGVSALSGEKTQSAVVHTIISKDGREVNITDDQDAYKGLVVAGKIVFNSREIALIKMSGANQDEAAVFLDTKQTFPGSEVSVVKAL